MRYIEMRYLALVLLGFLLIACNNNPTGQAVVDTVTIQSEQGKSTVMVREGDSSWCSEGSQWKMTGAEGNAEWVIQGIVSSGKYAGYCHVSYDIDSADTQADIDYYFNEDGDGYQVMNVNGQMFETEWKG